ncbi:hypothetical protein GHT06_005416 [Daphnia sinensis]|uniref:Uncharacterized protein n=1 Tax=Daphnia sinensis TaxID=1820382 RepID=A0AAD5KVY1_9CRUS|nr:hypothetical protein GHT06_005416 [Daphnia sinensis]
MNGKPRVGDPPGKTLKDGRNERTTLTEVIVQLKPINNVLTEKETELRQLCATDFSPSLIEKINDLIRTHCIVCVNTIQVPT